MKAAVALLLIATASSAIADTITRVVTIPATAESALNGKWTVDLSSDADGSYKKEMFLTLLDDGTISGMFYDSEIMVGRWKKSRGRTCVSFRTTDGQGPYQTAACLSGSKVLGQTWAEHRSFLFNWNAKRTK